MALVNERRSRYPYPSGGQRIGYARTTYPTVTSDVERVRTAQPPEHLRAVFAEAAIRRQYGRTEIADLLVRRLKGEAIDIIEPGYTQEKDGTLREAYGGGRHYFLADRSPDSDRPLVLGEWDGNRRIFHVDSESTIDIVASELPDVEVHLTERTPHAQVTRSGYPRREVGGYPQYPSYPGGETEVSVESIFDRYIGSRLSQAGYAGDGGYGTRALYLEGGSSPTTPVVERNFDNFGLLSGEEYISRRSETLLSDPSAVLDEGVELARYVASLPSDYASELRALIGDAEPMAPETRVAVCIPAYDEGLNIYKTMEFFSSSQRDRGGNPLDPGLYELVVFENHPYHKTPDDTRNEIERFKKEHPEVRVVHGYKQWPQDQGTRGFVGISSKYATDLALVRGSDRQERTGDLILVRTDGDLKGVTEQALVTLIEDYDASPNVDAIVGKANIPTYALDKPNIRAAYNLWQIIEILIRTDAVNPPGSREPVTPKTLGTSTSARASIVAAIGGYNGNAVLAEDLEVGWMISDAREWTAGRIGYEGRYQTIVDPRRYIATVAQGRPLIATYDNFLDEDWVRTADTRELLARIPDQFDQTTFARDAEAIYQQGISGAYQWLGEGFLPIFQRAMGIIGAEFDVVDGHVELTNIDRLTEGLTRPVKRRASEVM